MKLVVSRLQFYLMGTPFSRMVSPSDQHFHGVSRLKLFAELAGEVLGQFIVDPRDVFPDVVVEATCQIPSHFYAEVR